MTICHGPHPEPSIGDSSSGFLRVFRCLDGPTSSSAFSLNVDLCASWPFTSPLCHGHVRADRCRMMKGGLGPWLEAFYILLLLSPRKAFPRGHTLS